MKGKTVMENNNSKIKQLNNDRNQGTFIVRIDYCQNNSWQGKVTWADQNKTRYFRSALELIRIMDEAMEMQHVNSKEDNVREVSIC